MSREYHCLVAGLHDYIFEDKQLVISLLDFKNLLKEELHPEDYGLIKTLFLPYDNHNILSFLKIYKHGFNPLGNFTTYDFQDQITYQTSEITESVARFPEYLETFVAAHHTNNPIYPNMNWANQLFLLFYHYIKSFSNDFLKNWFEFDLNCKNVLTAITCRTFNINPELEIVGDNIIAQQLKKNTTKDFGLVSDFPAVEELVKISEIQNLLVREQKIDLLKWNYLEENTFFEYFTIEKIIGYTLKLMMIERWTKLDVETGKKMFNRLISEIETSYEFPEEFKI